MVTALLVPFIGGGFSIVVALIHKSTQENRKDHGRVHEALGRIEHKIDSHVENHK